MLDSRQRAHAKRAAGTAGRLGLATRGVLYGLVGVLYGLVGLSPTARRVIAVVRGAGYVGRTLALVLVGWFLIHAARTYDPQEATGLDVALTKVEQTAYGSWLTTIVGAGLIAFSAHLVLEAVYAPRGDL